LANLVAHQSAGRHRAMPHRRAGRPYRLVFALWPSSHLLQFVPQPALPEVPEQRTRPLARRAAFRTAGHGPASMARFGRFHCRGASDTVLDVLGSVGFGRVVAHSEKADVQ
jgi:hypothetical protein